MVVNINLSGLTPDTITTENLIFTTDEEFYIPLIQGTQVYSEKRTVEIPAGYAVNKASVWIAAFDYWFLHKDESLKERPICHVRFAPDIVQIGSTNKCTVELQADLRDENGDDYWKGWAVIFIMFSYQ